MRMQDGDEGRVAGVVKRPMQRVVVVGCLVFLMLMSGVLSLTSYQMFSSWFYRHYEEELAHVIDMVYGVVDVDDLQRCVRTGVPSDKFYDLQKFLNGAVDDFGLAYLYISYPDGDNMVSVCSATSEAERAMGEDDWPLLYVLDGEYTPDQLALYKAAWDNDGISYFEDSSPDWGDCYTACLPLHGTDGEPVALLCADVFVNEMHSDLRDYAIRMTVIIMGMGVAFAVMLIFWISRNVTSPLLRLEQSVRRFAERSRGNMDPAALSFEAPDIHTRNEIESLAQSVMQMSNEMRDHVENILCAELRAQSAEAEAQDMSYLALSDPLTHVKSKVAYVLDRERLSDEVAVSAAEFALVMVDLNNLKLVNDTYGHERGDRYLLGACGVVCDVYAHSPVYRIGGDEFLVLLEGRDYDCRDELIVALGFMFDEMSGDESREPWERYSAAFGMAVYDSSVDGTFDDVFARADQEMYSRKVAMRESGSISSR